MEHVNCAGSINVRFCDTPDEVAKANETALDVGSLGGGGRVPQGGPRGVGHLMPAELDTAAKEALIEDVRLGDSRPQIESSHVGVKFHFKATRNIVIPDGLRLVEAYLRHQPGRGKFEGTHLYGRLGFTIVESSDPKAIANSICGAPFHPEDHVTRSIEGRMQGPE